MRAGVAARILAPWDAHSGNAVVAPLASAGLRWLAGLRWPPLASAGLRWPPLASAGLRWPRWPAGLRWPPLGLCFVW